MKKTLIASAILGMSCVAQAESNECRFSTDFDIDINDTSVVFEKEAGDKIEFKGKELLINGESIKLTPAQTDASLSLQDGARSMVPKIAKIAVEGAELGIKASTMVLGALFGNDPDMHKDLIKPIEKISETVQKNISKTKMNTAELEKVFEEAFDEEFEQMIETAASKYSGKIVGNVLSAVFSGDSEELKDFEFRMENLERDIEKYVEANAKDLEKQAESLCTEIAVLEKFDTLLESVEGYPKEGVIQADGDGLNVNGFTWSSK